MTALAWAAIQGHENVADMLLKAGANPDIQDQVRVQYYCACCTGNPR